MDQSPAAAAQRLAFNKRALISAVKTSDTETVADLLDGGVPIDTKDDDGMSLLHWAAECGHATTMRFLIRRGCDVDSVDCRGFTPLHCAAAMGQTKVVRELIRKRAPKSVVAGNYGTPLNLAAGKGHVRTVVAMLDEGCPLDVVDSNGTTVLHAAAEGGHVELVRELVGRGCNVNEVKVNGCTPLHDAAGCGRTETVCELIKLGANVFVDADSFGTPLHQAAFNGHVETVAAMLEKGCPLEMVSSAGSTILYDAAAGGHIEVVKELEYRGCDLNAAKKNGFTPLHAAARCGRTEAVRELIKLGAMKSVVASTYGTPLHQAAGKGHMETVVAMLEEGCPLDVVGHDESTVLHFAAESGIVELVRELVGRGCDVNAVKRNGGTPLHRAAACGNTEAVQELIRCGASKSIVVNTFGTPLHQAAINGNVETLKAMLEKRCPLDVVDSDGSSVLHWAAVGGHVEVVKELVDRGCDVNAVKENDCTPLHDAAGCGRTEAVRELIKSGASKSVVASTFGTPLHQAVYNRHMETAVAMLEEGCPLDVLDSDESSVLHWAAECGDVKLVKELVERGCNVNAVEANGHTPLHVAAGCDRAEVVCELIKLGATKSVVAGMNGTPLHQAVSNGHVETAVTMLEQGCPHDTVDSAGATVLHWAAKGGNVELVRELVDRGCDVNAVNANGCTPLHDAAGCGRIDVVCELIKRDATKSLVAGVFGTPLHYAAAMGQTKAVLELIRNGASKSVVAGNCGTPLHQAVYNGHVETVVAMLEEGCPLDEVNTDGATVMHWAAQGNHLEVLKELVSRGCDVNAAKTNGCTPLHDAAGCGRTEAVCELIKHGATMSVFAGGIGTPLDEAALYGHVETVVTMIEEGCPFGVVNSAGATVLHWAAAGGHVEVVKELVDRGCDVNAVKVNGCTPLHVSAAGGRTEAVHELIKLGATRSQVAGMYGVPLHQAVGSGCVDTVEALLEEEFCEHDLINLDTTPSKVQLSEWNTVACNSFGQSPVMWAVRYGLVEVFKLLIPKGGTVFDKDAHSLSTFEHCFLSGHAYNLSQFCKASGIKSSGEGLRGDLATLITQGLVDAHKVLSLCAISGDSVFLEDEFSELVASNTCALPGAVKCAKCYFYGGESVPFLNQLRIPDESTLNPLHISLLSLKCCEMECARDGIHCNTKDHTSFITKLLSHPMLKETVHEHFPNGLSPLDLARQFELHHIAALVEGAGGCPGVWADVPQDMFLRRRSELFTISSLLKQLCDTTQSGHEAMKEAMLKLLGAQTVEKSRPVVLAKEQDELWHPNAFIVSADVGAERDDHEYQSLSQMVSVDNVSHLIVKCKTGINAMLNHSEGGSIHFGIGSNGIVEEGLDLEKNEVIYKLRMKVGEVLRKFWPTVESKFVQVEPVYLKNDKQELTGRWRFDIVVLPHPTVVQLSRGKAGYYRHGATNVAMTYDVFVQKVRAESAHRRRAKEATFEDGRISVWDANAAATINANVGAEQDGHEYISLEECVDVSNLIVNCDTGINAMLNHSEGGSIHFGIGSNGIVEEGLDFKSEVISELRRKVDMLLRKFCPAVESKFVQVEPVYLKNDKQELTGRWRFDIVVIPHPTVVQLAHGMSGYYRHGATNVVMTYDVFAEKIRAESAHRRGSMEVTFEDGRMSEWDANAAATINANVGAEQDGHEYISLKEYVDVSNLIVNCDIGISAMLNHCEGGSIHFGIGSNGIVEEGLDLEKYKILQELRVMVGDMLRTFWHQVDSSYVQIEPVNLKNGKQELTGKWRFDIVMKPHPIIVQLTRGKPGYYRHEATNVVMTYDVFAEKIRAESANRRRPKEATDEGGRVSVWDENAAATVGANVGAEAYDHEYKTLGTRQCPPSCNVVRRVCDDSCKRAINAMLHNLTGGTIHFGIQDNGIVEDGLGLEQNHTIDMLKREVNNILMNFYPPVENFFVQVKPVKLLNGKQEFIGRWRFDIVLKPHPTVVLLSQNKSAYHRCGPQNKEMVYHMLAGRVRREPAGQLPHGY